MREFLFGHETALELVGWHLAVLLALLTGYGLGYFVHNKKD